MIQGMDIKTIKLSPSDLRRALSNVLYFITDEIHPYLTFRVMGYHLEIVAFDKYSSIIDRTPIEESVDYCFDIVIESAEKLLKFVAGVKDLKRTPGVIHMKLDEDYVVFIDIATGNEFRSRAFESNNVMIEQINVIFSNKSVGTERMTVDFGILQDRMTRFSRLKPSNPSGMVLRLCRNPLPNHDGTIMYIQFGARTRIAIAGFDLEKGRENLTSSHGEDIARESFEW